MPLPFWIKVQNLMVRINHIFIFGMAAVFTMIGIQHDFKDTAMHMFLTCIGFHVLAAEAMMSHWPANPLTRRLAYRNKSRVHGLLQALGGGMALVGSLYKISATEVHFTTLHGKVGLAATFMCASSLIGGLANYFQPKLALQVYTPSELKFRHNLFGILTFTLGMATIYLGYGTQFTLRKIPTSMVPGLMRTTVIVYTLSIFAPVKSLLHKLSLRRNRQA